MPVLHKIPQCRSLSTLSMLLRVLRTAKLSSQSAYKADKTGTPAGLRWRRW